MLYERCHEDSARLHIGCEKPRSDIIPFSSAKAALLGEKDTSDRMFCLTESAWKFKLFESYDSVPDMLMYYDADVSSWDEVHLPHCWQLEGYCAPQFKNHGKTMPLDVPFVDSANPTGVYVREFELGKDTDNFQKYLIFKGVSSCLYLYVNGEFAGYTQGSFNTSEFCISEYVKSGINRITAVVLKNSFGSYLELRQEYEMSGIFRDVFLSFRENEHIEDVEINTARLQNGGARITATLFGKTTENSFVTLFDPEGLKLDAAIPMADGTVRFNIDKPLLWSAETPALYTVLVECQNEFFAFKTGIRTVAENEEGVFINGVKTRLCGVFYNEFDSVLGNVCNTQRIENDLRLMKSCNINTIVSEKPASSTLLFLCNKLGFYVIESPDIDCGVFNNIKSTDTADVISGREYEAAFIDRAMRTLELHKNNTCIIAWRFTGNKIAQNMQSVAEWTSTRDRSRFIIFGGAAEKEIENFPDFCDLGLKIGGNSFNNRYIFPFDLDATLSKSDFSPSLKLLNGEPSQKLKELKYKYQPVEMEYTNGELTVKNRYDFLYLSRLDGEYEIMKYGVCIEKGKLPALCLAPHKEIKTKITINTPLKGIMHLRVSYKAALNGDAIPHGTELAAAQFLLCNDPEFTNEPSAARPKAFNEKTRLTVKSGAVTYTFSKLTGKLVSLTNDEAELLTEPMQLYLPCNSSSFKHSTRAWDFRYDFESKCVAVKYSFSLCARGETPAAEGKCIFRIFPNGVCKLSITAYEKNDESKPVSVGIRLCADRFFEKSQYLGNRDSSNVESVRLNIMSVQDGLEQKALPTVLNYCKNVLYAAVLNNDDFGIAVSNFEGFNYSCCNYKAETLENCDHIFDLPAARETVLCFFKNVSENAESSFTIKLKKPDDKLLDCMLRMI